MSESSRLKAYHALGLGPRWTARRPVLEAAADASSGAAAAIPDTPSDTHIVGVPDIVGGAEHGEAAIASFEAGPAQALPIAVDDVAGLDWDALQARVRDCQACGLCKTRTQTVFGVGSRDARWMLVGEAPGAEEDLRGEPFVGKAGRLLDAMLAAIGLDRERDVFIANVLKCRPPRNRDPLPEEVSRCEPFLMRQIELVAPDVVLLFGRFAAQSMLGTDASIASLRGRRHRLTVAGREVPAIVTYHPAYLLRTPQDKAKAWRDLLMARQVAAGAGGGPAGGASAAALG